MILAIRRAPRFSPNSVKKDAEIMESVCRRLKEKGYGVTEINEEELTYPAFSHGQWDACLSMGRLPQTLLWLRQEEKRGCTVINSTEGVALCCQRRRLTEKLQEALIPTAPEQGDDGYWLKRGDGVAETQGDVRFAPDRSEMESIKKQMKASGINDIVVSAHVKGDLIKFYGVRGCGFFRTFYPGADGQSKFGDEQRNGAPHYYIYNTEALQQDAEHAALLTGTDVYGGDCIVRPDGTYCIIDFNDWPSFSRCREDAARAIAEITVRSLQK